MGDIGSRVVVAPDDPGGLFLEVFSDLNDSMIHAN